MATFAIGDIHGHRDALHDLLEQLEPEVARQDTVVFLGDYIDRGRDSKGCIDLILEFRRSVDAESVCLAGNHEDWLLKTMRDYSRHSWLLGMEAFDTIRSYSADAETELRQAMAEAGLQLFLRSAPCLLPYNAFFDRVPREHIDFFEGLRTHHKTGDCVCVHAGLDPSLATLDEQPRDALIWGTKAFPSGYTGAEAVVYGHWNNATPAGDGSWIPARHGSAIGIDTIAHGVLTAIRLPDERIFQSALPK